MGTEVVQVLRLGFSFAIGGRKGLRNVLEISGNN